MGVVKPPACSARRLVQHPHSQFSVFAPVAYMLQMLIVNCHLQPHLQYHKYCALLCFDLYPYVFLVSRDIVRFAFCAILQKQLAEFSSE